MDYEKAYKEALESAREIIKDYEKRGLKEQLFYAKEDLEGIFPELKESEDEKMWKLIKKYAHYNISDIALDADHITREQLESWLEKQGEKKATYKVNPTLEDKVNILADKIIDLRLIVKALEIQAIRQCSDKNRLDSLESKMIILDSYNINNRLDALESSVFEEGK